MKKLWTVLAVGGFLLAAVLLSIRAGSRVNQPGVRYPESDPVHWALRDFRDAIYYPVIAVRDRVSPYHVSTYVTRYPVGQDFPPYSPLSLAIHFPFGWLPFQISQWVHFGVSIALSLALAWLVLSVCGISRTPGAVFAIGTAILLSRPGHMNLLLGQTTVPLAICSLAAIHLAGSRPWMAACLLALATAKPTYGFPLMALLFAAGHRAVVIRAFAVTLLLTVPLMIGVIAMQGGLEESLKIWTENRNALYDNPGRDPAQSFSRIDAFALAARWIGSSPRHNAELIVSALLLAGGCWLLFKARRRPARPDRDSSRPDEEGTELATGRQFQQGASLTPQMIFALLMMLVGVYHHAYDAVLLVPVLLMAGLARDSFWKAWPSGARWLWCGLISVPLVNYIATNSVIDAYDIRGSAWTLVTSLNGAALCAATLWLAIALYQDTKKERQLKATELKAG